MNRAITVTLAVLGLIGFGTSQAVPCGDYAAVGGVSQSIDCRNGRQNDRYDTVRDLNRGNYFGFSDWQLLDRTNDGANPAFWTVSPRGTRIRSGTFTLAPELWSLYEDLVVVLKGRGSTSNNNILWAGYLLPDGTFGPYDWSYDNHRRVWRLSLYARGNGETTTPPNRVPEPATLALVIMGLAALAMARRRVPVRG